MRKTIAAALAALLIAALPARAEVGEVRLGLQFGFVYLPIVIGAEEGLIDKRAKELGLGGLKVTLNRFSGSTAMNDAVLSGSIEFGAFGAGGLLISWDKTRGRMAVKGLAALARSTYIVVTNKPGIRTLKDFGENDRIALPANNAPQAIILKMASEQLYGPGQYGHFDKMMSGLPHPDAVAALLSNSGTVNGYVSTAPFQQILLKDPRIHAVATSREILGEEITGAAVGGMQKFVEANPKVTRAVFLGLEDAIRFIREKTPRAAEIYLASEKSTLSQAEVETMLLDGSTDFDIAPHGLVKLAQFMVKIGMIGRAPADWKEVFFDAAHDRPGS